MRKIINTLIFLVAILLILGHFQNANPETSHKLGANIYRRVRTEVSKLYEMGEEALEALLMSSKFTDTLESTTKNVISSFEGLNNIPLIKNLENPKATSGMPDYKHTVNTFEEYYKVIYNALNNFEPSFTIRLNNYSPTIYNLEAVNQVIYDNFDIDYGIKGINATLYSGSRFHAITITPEYAFDRDSMVRMKSAAETKAAQIISTIIKPSMTDLQKERAIHDYIVKNTAYDYDNLSRGTLPEEVYTMYGALINGKAVCAGYAKAMFKLLTMAGVENMVVIGEADGTPHSWNLVKINDSYTHLDATWDDPVTGTNRGILSHKYFNISDQQISKTHNWDTSKYPKGVSVPMK
jgi:hypothetical protein